MVLALLGCAYPLEVTLEQVRLIVGWVDAGQRDPAITEEFYQDILRLDHPIQHLSRCVYDGQQP